MKTAVKPMDYDDVMALPRPEHKAPVKPNLFFRTLMRVLSEFGLMGAGFRYEKKGMEKIGKDEPCLILMNHSCFLDLMMVSKLFYPKPYCIVCTSDGFVGKEKLMRAVGCIPTRKFVTDLTLVQDMLHCLKEEKTSVLMYPEASYSFDGTATPLPRKMGVILKKLDVPVVMIKTEGAFTRNPLYNELQVRKSVPIRARMECLYTRDEVRTRTVQELSDGLDRAFTFDHFAWQKENGIRTEEDFRADGLHRILYKCSACGRENAMVGRGTTLTCGECKSVWSLTPLGELEPMTGQNTFRHIPDWYAWQRQEVRREIAAGEYRVEADVDICMMVDYEAIYRVGSGHLTHSTEGFSLTGCDGRLHYVQPPQACYGLYADYYWYELGDIICIGNNDCLYYCFPKNETPVAKTRMAAEELYRIIKESRRKAATARPDLNA